MKWGDDGSKSEYIDINTMDGEPLNLPLQSHFEGSFLDLSHQQLDPGYVEDFGVVADDPFHRLVSRHDQLPREQLWRGRAVNPSRGYQGHLCSQSLRVDRRSNGC